MENPLARAVATAILCSHEFIAGIEERHLEDKDDNPDIPELRKVTFVGR